MILNSVQDQLHNGKHMNSTGSGTGWAEWAFAHPNF